MKLMTENQFKDYMASNTPADVITYLKSRHFQFEYCLEQAKADNAKYLVDYYDRLGTKVCCRNPNNKEYKGRGMRNRWCGLNGRMENMLATIYTCKECGDELPDTTVWA